MMTSMRSLLNHELKIAELSANWWQEEVFGLLIINAGILLAALKHVPPARDCYRIGLGHGQCVKVSGSRNLQSALANAMGKRGAVMNGCEVYIQSWRPKLARLCAIRGVKKIYYTDGEPSLDEIRALKAKGAEAIRVRV